MKRVKDGDLKANIKYYMTLYGVNAVKTAAAVGLSPATFYKRMAYPKSFTFGDLQNMAALWHISVADLLTERE